MTRCPRTWFLLRHDPMLVQKRDRSGHVVKPHTLIWECRICGKPVGESTLSVQWRMLAQLRRDAGQLEKARKSS
jgi:hypothetical protein